MKGYKPFNKGVPMAAWMDGRKIKRVKKYLEIGHKLGNKKLAGANRIPIVGIKDGKLYSFESATKAAEILKAKGIRINKRNISHTVHGNRRRAGGFYCFNANDVNKYSKFLN